MNAIRERKRRELAVDIDIRKFWDAVEDYKTSKNISFTKLGKDINMPVGTFTRIEYAADGVMPNYRPSLARYLTLCWRIGRDPGEFIVFPPEED